MSEKEVLASLHLNSIKDIGPARFQALMRKYSTAVSAIANGVNDWSDVPFFDGDTLSSIKNDFDAARRRAEQDFSSCAKWAVRTYLWQQGSYPALLKQIVYPPPVLYVMGDDICLPAPAIAIVGSRRCSYYGENMARRLSSDLAAAGVTTISGLARGIDTHVHHSTIQAGGKTWAVIGSGLSHQYPPENKRLAQLIAKKGAIVSEFPMATRPFPANFPRRNRIIAGLSLGTVVVEGSEKSGSLITARLAAEEGRDVFAVPGPATSELSVAPHRLLQMGAMMVERANDILQSIGLPATAGVGKKESARSDARPGIYNDVLAFLSAEPVPKEILAQRLNKDARLLSSLLLEMELKGLIRSVPGGGVLKT